MQLQHQLEALGTGYDDSVLLRATCKRDHRFNDSIACGSGTTHSFRYRTNGCDIYRCESCGLRRAETSGFDPRAYYTGDYFSGQCSDGYSDYRAAEPILRREFARSVEFVHRFCRGGKLLDLGCAYGFFLKEAQRYFDGSGIELAEEAAEHCR